jgi:hypothetical protein
MITYQRFDDVPGRAIAQLRQATGFPGAPDFIDSLTVFSSPGNVGDNYGARIYGYLCPPETGAYTFWVAGDDNVELNLSTTADPADLRRIAFHTDYTAPEEWEKYASQQSENIQLQAGTPYFVEALMNEAGGGDHLSVGWQLPSGGLQRPIGPAAISTMTGDALTGMAPDRAVFPLSIFPNPATGRVIVSFDYPHPTERASLQLVAMDGKTIGLPPRAISAGSNRLFLERPGSIPTGVYLLRLQTGKAVYQARLIYGN